MSSGKKQLAVIGHPVVHSLSPLMQQAWMDTAGLEGSYAAMDVEPGKLADFIAGVRDGALDGFNVTLPHKRAVMKFMDGLDESAQKTGAVNTVVRDASGRLTGFNTDVEGICLALSETVPDWHGTCERIILIGAGGAARAALSALSPLEGKTILIANRTVGHAEDLARGLCPDAQILSLDRLLSAPLEADLVINASSAGLASRNPLHAEFSSRQKGIALDCVYRPAETEFLKRARTAGWQNCDGLAMLIHQGAAAFCHWWGEPPASPGAIRDKLLAAMEGK